MGHLDLPNLFSLQNLRFRPMSVCTGRRSAKGLSRNIFTALFAFLLFNGSATAVAQNGTFPLEPPDTTSPRGALFNLIDNVDEAHRVLDAASRDYWATPGLFKSAAVRAQEAQAAALLRQAAGSLDLSQVRPAILKAVRLEAVLQLKEVLDRIDLPSTQAMPDEETVKAKGLTRWRIPHTSIDIVQVTEGPQAGEFLFSPDTVRQANTYYQRVKHLPYLTEGAEGSYERYISNPGRLLTPKWLAWVVDMPGWTQRLYYGQTVWQWTALALTLFVLFSVLYALSRWKSRLGVPDSDVYRILDRLLVPAVALLGLWLARDFLVQQISFTGQGLIIVVKGLLVPARLLEAYIAYLVSVLVAERIISSPRIDAASLDANMIRMVARVLGIAVGLAIIFTGANELGVPLVPLIASLGVGGLAVALAARPTLENLIGGIILYTDRPVCVGDFCRFGNHEGNVERIGVRSTQIRARDRTVITVPNAAFADMEIINWARCDNMLIQTTIGLRYETTLEQLRYVLSKLREMFIAHPKIGNDTVRVRFVGYGSSSLDIEIRVYALTRDWSEFYAIQEDVFLRVGEIVDEAGTSFAFPSQTLYMGRDVGLDAERGNKVSQQVQSWRKTGQLPFPHMARSRREQLADTLDYPPRGSPDARHPEIHDAEESEPLSKDTESTTQPVEPERGSSPDGSASRPYSSDRGVHRKTATPRAS
jgi:MscS family membrane protein